MISHPMRSFPFNTACFPILHIIMFKFALIYFRNGGLRGGNVDLVLSCVDNFEARMAINMVISPPVDLFALHFL